MKIPKSNGAKVHPLNSIITPTLSTTIPNQKATKTLYLYTRTMILVQ